MDDGAAVEIWRLMRELTHRPEVLGRGQAVAEAAGVPTGLAKALARLSPEHPTPMRELAHALRCDASYITAVVDGLEEHGLACRRPHPTDRRVKVVELTPVGAELGAQVRTALDEPPAALAALEPCQLGALLELMRQVASGTHAG